MSAAKEARNKLKGSWGIAIGAEGILLLLQVALLAGEWAVWKQYGTHLLWLRYFLPAAALLADGMLLSPLRLWRAEIFVHVVCEKQNAFMGIVRAFGWRAWLRALRFGALTLLCDVGTAAVCGLPAALFAAFRAALFSRDGAAILLYLFGEGVQAALWLLCVLFWVLWRLYRMPIPYRLAADPALSVRHAFVLSHRIMRGRVSLCASRLFGFIGWGLASLLLLPYAYAAPVYHTVLATQSLLPPLPKQSHGAQRSHGAHFRPKRSRRSPPPATAP